MSAALESARRILKREILAGRSVVALLPVGQACDLADIHAACAVAGSLDRLVAFDFAGVDWHPLPAGVHRRIIAEEWPTAADDALIEACQREDGPLPDWGEGRRLPGRASSAAAPSRHLLGKDVFDDRAWVGVPYHPLDRLGEAGAVVVATWDKRCGPGGPVWLALRAIEAAERAGRDPPLLYRTCGSAPARPRQRLAGGEDAMRVSAY